jgi:multiple sugar transport system substrate-binding protein
MANAFRRATLTLAAGLALGLGHAGASAQEKTVVTFARFFGACEADFGNVTDVSKSAGECGIITALTNKFNATNTLNAVVKTQVIEWGPYYDQLGARIVAKDIPAIAVMHEAVLGDYVKRNLVEPLDAGFKDVGLDTADFTPHARRGTTFGGKTYALPFDTHSWLWHVNLNLMKKAGLTNADGSPVIPKTPDELLAHAKKFKAATGKPYFVWCVANETAAYTRTFLTLLYQQGGTVFPKGEREISLQSKEARKAIELMKTLYENGDIVPNTDYGASIQAFTAGDGGVMVNGTWLIGDMITQSQKAGGALDKGYATLPFANLYSQKATWADGHAWIMLKGGTKDEKTKKAALAFLKFLYDNDHEWARTGHLPTRTSVITSKEFNALPFRSSIGAIAQSGISLSPTVPRQFRIQEMLGEALSGIVISKKPIDMSIKEAEDRINKMLASAK